MRHVKPGILGVTPPSPHRRELLKLPPNRTQVADQQVQILPRSRQPVAAIAHLASTYFHAHLNRLVVPAFPWLISYLPFGDEDLRCGTRLELPAGLDDVGDPGHVPADPSIWSWRVKLAMRQALPVPDAEER